MGDSKSQRTSQSHYWFKSNSNVAEKEEFFLSNNVVKLVKFSCVFRHLKLHLGHSSCYRGRGKTGVGNIFVKLDLRLKSNPV